MRTQSLQHMEYEYDPQTYSLTRRNNVLHSRDERFTYDELDRLTAVTMNNLTTNTVSYEANGNIQTRTDVGTYLYDDTRPHALAGIADATDGYGLTDIEQDIDYTPFNKVSCVQHHGGKNDRYEILYGLDRQRIKTTYYTNGERQYDRYYFGTYEKEVSRNNYITHTDHIYTPTGLTAIRKNDILYFVLTDHMGSVQTITGSRMPTVLSQYVYEAWGGRKLLYGSEFLTDRGYTGHEHLEPLGLIDMNGRIYDPTLARFLSPDPYVQAPDFTQGLNRYSYCLNNRSRRICKSVRSFIIRIYNPMTGVYQKKHVPCQRITNPDNRESRITNSA